MYKYYYGVCEHCLCVQFQPDARHEVGQVDKNGFLYLLLRDDEKARCVFGSIEGKKANECEDEERAARYRRRLLAILKEPVLEVRYDA